MGRADYLDEGTWNARCSMCNAKRKASELVKNWQGQWRCPEHNEPRQPQDFVRGVPDIQAAPWVQQPGVLANTTAYLLIEASSASVDLSTLFTSTYTGVSGQVGTGGVTTVIVTVQPGNTDAQVIINALTVGTTWPASVTRIIINIMGGGFILAYTDISGLAVTINQFGGRYTPASTHTLTAGSSITPGVSNIYGLYTAFAIGSILPTTFGGQTIQILAAVDLTPIGGSMSTIVQMSGHQLQSFFTSLTVNGSAYLTASAPAFGFSGADTQWGWTGMAFAATGTYPVSIL